MYGTPPDLAQRHIAQSWQALWIFSAYRVGLATLLLLLHHFGSPYLNLIDHQGSLYGLVIQAYCLFAILCLPFIYKRLPNFELQVVFQVFVDIIVLTLLIGVGGDVNHDLGVLINIAIASGSLLTAGRTSLLFAAMATLAIFAEQLSFSLANVFVADDYVSMGQLGITFFITAILGHVLAKRLRRSEILALQHGAELTELARLNSHVLERLQSGIVVLAADGSLQLLNQAARDLLAYPGRGKPSTLAQLATELDYVYQQWLQDPISSTQVMKLPRLQRQLIVQLTHLGEAKRAPVLVFLDDDLRTVQQAQAMKLASLGRLSASIAHEIRNPLGAISHAAQLLEEADDLQESDKRFIEIIRSNSARMNRVINSVLSLSRREESQWNDFCLVAWLRHYVDNFLTEQAKAIIKLTCSEQEIRVHADKIQLAQIMNNLCENGLRHSAQATGQQALNIHLGTSSTSTPYIDIIDRGLGIRSELREQVFEPFYTTWHQGTGLGLYIARELAEANKIRLLVRETEGPGACFRLNFYR